MKRTKIKRTKVKQTPFTPLIFMAIIMCGFILGTKGKDRANQVNKTNGKHVQEDRNQTVDGSQASEVDQKSDVNQLTLDDNKDVEDSQTEQDAKSDAELALVEGIHIQSEIKDEYAKSVVEDYCKRNVVACSSSNMVRYNEKNIYRQSFDKVTGYMTLAQLTAAQDTIAQWQVSTEIENITVVLVFPDRSYICLENNKSIECALSKGASTILYIGQNLKGSIEVKLQENKHITAKRM